jgi:hypothetical protein
MRKLILSATIVASSFLSYAQWRNVDHYTLIDNESKGYSYKNLKEAKRIASFLFDTMGYCDDLDALYIDKEVPVMGYFKKNGLIHGLIVIKADKGRYDLLVMNHPDESRIYYQTDKVVYGYRKR